MKSASLLEQRPPWLVALAAFLVTVVPALLPLALTHHYYNSDWFIHLWPSSFTTGFFKFHHSIPVTINADGRIASFPNHPFYGYLMYSIAGVLGALLGGGEEGLRAACAGALILQFILVFKAVRAASESTTWAALAAGVVTTAIYPLTNLYHRAAVPEFFTGCFLTSSLCCWVLLLNARSKRNILLIAPWFGFCLANVAGSHPITSMYAVVLLAPVFIASLPALRRMPRSLRPAFWTAAALAVVFALLVDGALLYSLAVLSPKVGAARAGGLVFLVDRGDFWWSRFFPFPFDKTTLLLGTHTDTPYLELQLNVPLLALLGVAAVALLPRGKRPRASGDRAYLPLLVLSAFAFAALVWASVGSTPWALAPKVLTMIQFPYRLINYANLMTLSMLLAILSLRQAQKTEGPTPTPTLALTAIATLALCVLCVKLVHVGATKTDKRLVGAPASTAYQEVYGNYMFFTHYTLAGLPKLTPAEAKEAVACAFPLGQTGAEFGHLGDAVVDLAKPSWVLTSLAAHDWNVLSVDGATVPLSKLSAFDSRFALRLGAGRHVLHAVVEPDPLWRWLRDVSLFVLLVGVIACGATGLAWRGTGRTAS